MAFIISAGTQVTGFTTIPGGIQSVGLATNVSPNRLFQLGSAVPFAENVTVQKQLSLVCYGGASNEYITDASLNCNEPAPLSINIYSVGCDSTIINDTTDWWVTGYSYAKEIQGWGLETWNLVSKPIFLNQDLTPVEDVTIRMIRGISEGEETTDGKANTGIVFASGTDGNYQILDENTLNFFVGTIDVRADNPGIGRANTKRYGVVKQVGKGTGKLDGKDGNGSANIPYTPIFIPD